MSNFLKKIHGFERKALRRHRMNEANRKFPSNKLVPLDELEKKLIREKWGKLSKYGLVNNDYYKVFAFYKYFRNPLEIDLSPSDFYLMCELILNIQWSLNVLSHKSNLHFFIPEKNRPQNIVYGIHEHIYNANDSAITKNEAFDLIKKHEQFVVKQSIFTGGGKGVKRFENACDEHIRDILKSSDFIVQEILVQHDFFAELNPSSVNTIRMETLYLNDTSSVLSAFVRIGAKGCFVDNITGREGMVVGVDEQGRLSPFGLTSNYDKVYESSSGKKFEGLVIPNYQNIKETIMDFHKRFPLVNLINWDIALDENGIVKIIEINLNAMNPLYHQIFNGPLFKDRTDEVVDWVIRHSK